MLELENPIQEAYQRSLSELAYFQQTQRTNGLSAEDVIRAHFLIVNHFYIEGGGLGGIGPKSIPLLLSAVDRQFVSYGGRDKWTSKFDICATLFFGLIKNHPFHDANKRTAFLSVLYLLYKFKRCPSVPESEFEDFTVEVADNLLVRYARFRELVKDKEEDPEVKFISKYLKDNTRDVDSKSHSITYRELKKILNRYGYDFSSPKGNYIDVIRVGTRKKFFGLFGSEPSETRVCQIGFPRWTDEVGRAALKEVRESTNLSARDGVDSAAFYKGLDPMQSLIATYNRPLMNLASR